MNIKEKILKITNIASWILVIIMLLLIIFIQAAPKFGYTVEIIKSGSMKPTIKQGSLIVVKPEEHYNKGEIVSFTGHSKTNDYVTHRITKVEKQNGGREYYTKGDANEIPDQGTVKDYEIIGKLWLNIPYLGSAIEFSKTIPGTVIFLVIPTLIIFYEDLEKLYIKFNKNKKDEKKSSESHSKSEKINKTKNA